MKKLCIILLCIMLLGGITTKIAFADATLTKDIGAVYMDNTQNIKAILTQANEIHLISDGKTSSLDTGKALNVINKMLEGHHEMPAFGVSLDAETRKAINNGTWIEFMYDSTYTYNDMPFDRLLIEVNPDYSGFNIIRHHDGLYEGRCYYINLVDTTMKSLYEYLHGAVS